jgi:hypothetical protein
MPDTHAFSPPVNIFHPLGHAPDFAPTKSSLALTDWWRQSGNGLCCLVGLGGSGKTATIDYFLRSLNILPGGTSVDRGGKRSSLGQKPGAVLVFSLAEGTPDALFAELRGWSGLRGDIPAAGLYDAIRRVLASSAQASSGRILLVLDALEAIQTREEAGIGRLTDSRIRDLLKRVAYGGLPGVSVLASSRLPLVDIEVERLPLYWMVEVVAMGPEAAVAFLRARGLRQSDNELRRIARGFGYHALALDLFSGGGLSQSVRPCLEPPREAEDAVQEALSEMLRSSLGVW